MSDINIEAVVEEATPEVTTPESVEEKKPAKKTKQTRKPRARKVEDLIEEATRKMTDKEKDLLIAFLREDTNKLNNQILALKQNIESAYEKVNLIQADYEAMEKFYRDALQYIDGQVIAFANAVRKSTVAGGKN